MPRLFFALWPDAATRTALAAAADAIDVRDARRVPAANLHLTLLFLGQVEDAVAGRLAAAPLEGLPRAFTLDFGVCGWWRRSQVAWLAPLASPAGLARSRAAVLETAQAAGLAPARESFQAHVTVARGVRRAPRVHGAVALSWPVAAVALIESRAEAAVVRYAVRRSWPLEGSPNG